MPNIVFLAFLLPCFKVKVGVKVKGQGQGQTSRSNFWCAAFDIRGSALPSAAKSNKPKICGKVESIPVQGVCVCVCNQ